MRAPLLISFFVGFCSLSLEIAWVRLFGYANSSTPKAFGLVLALYLLGIAFGAQMGKYVCKLRDRTEIERASLILLSIGALTASAMPWLYFISRDSIFSEWAAYAAISTTAASLAVLFPVTHHLGVAESSQSTNVRKARHFSRVYLLNVLGAALGPLLTGYYLLDVLTTAQIFPAISAVLILVALVSAGLYVRGFSRFFMLTLAVCSGLVAVGGWESVRYPHVFISAFASDRSGKDFAIHEGRHGTILIREHTVTALNERPFLDYAVFGGNVYDGTSNVSLERNTNGLQRLMALHVIQPEAKRVLVLGLSIGTWLTVLNGFPGVDHIDVVEIDSGYLDVAKKFPAQSRAIKDPRVHVHVDDARRWLQFHPKERYDIILMNTTWHWRSAAGMLLSKEMMEIARDHLAPQGVLAFNATGSVDSFYTAASVFPFTKRYGSFIYAAQWDFSSIISNENSWKVLRRVTVDGSPAFDVNSIRIEEFSKIPFYGLEEDVEAAGRDPEIITDDNMLVEYRRGLTE
jgi:spermidine synthase